MPTDEKQMRAKRKDAALNNERLVQAAREVFAQQGFSATLEDIAKLAGVGVGTVYRNFASKREIVETLYEAAIEAALADVRTALEIEDPWTALVTFFEVTASHQAQDRGLGETFLGHDSFGPPEHAAERILAVVSPLFERARKAEVIRDGVTVTDILPIFAMLNAVYRMSSTQPDLWRRYLALLLDGLRADHTQALPVTGMDLASFTKALGTSD
jgi:AcrR family transcriptional regulator